MADQQISFVLKAVNQASAELARVSKDLASVTGAAKATTAEASSLGNAWAAGGRAASQGAGAATVGIRDLDKAAKDAVKGGVRELAGQIPVLGGTLSNLAGTLTGFPLLLGGVVAAGVGLLTFLNSLDAQATESARSMEKLAISIDTKFRTSILEANKTAARAGQDMLAQIQADYAAAVYAAEQSRADRKRVNEQMLEDNVSFWKILTGTATQALTKYRAEKQALDQQEREDDKRNKDNKLAAEVEFARVRLDQTKALYGGMRDAVSAAGVASLEAEGKITQALEAESQKRHGDITKEYNDRIDAIKKMRYSAEEEERQITAAQREEGAKRVSLEIETQEKRRAAIESATQSAGAIFDKLGAKFAESTKKLSVASYLQDAQRDIDALRKLQDAIASGDTNLQKAGVTMASVNDAIKQLGTNMADATARGAVPLAQASQATAAALEAVAPAAERAAEGAAALFNSGAAAPSLIATLDALIAKANQVQAAFAAAGRTGEIPVSFAGSVGGAGAPMRSTGPVGSAGDAGGGGWSNSALDRALLAGLTETANGPRGSGLTPLSSGASQYHDLGGISHPTGPVNMPSSRAGYGPAQTTVTDRAFGGTPVSVTFQSGAIVQQGTVIQGERDWQSLTSQLANDISARLRR